MRTLLLLLAFAGLSFAQPIDWTPRTTVPADARQTVRTVPLMTSNGPVQVPADTVIRESRGLFGLRRFSTRADGAVIRDGLFGTRVIRQPNR